MSNDQRLLWCLIDTDIDIESMPFEVTAPINASVNRLKELVWEKGKNACSVMLTPKIWCFTK
jgi:hypothetical protein